MGYFAKGVITGWTGREETRCYFPPFLTSRDNYMLIGFPFVLLITSASCFFGTMHADVDSAAVKQVGNHEDVRVKKVCHPLTGNLRHDKKNNVSNRLQGITRYIKTTRCFEIIHQTAKPRK